MYIINDNKTKQFEGEANELFILIEKKRDNFRVQIRRQENKIKTNQRRRILLQSLNLMNSQILEYFKQHQKKTYSDRDIQMIYKLETQNDDPDFNNKINEFKLEEVLYDYLTASLDLKVKFSLLKSINHLLFYSSKSNHALIELDVTDFFFKQFKEYSFIDEQENQYLDQVLQAIRNISCELNQDYNSYLEDLSFCKYIEDKIQREGLHQVKTIECKEKLLLKLRTNIIKTLKSKKQKFLRETVDFMSLQKKRYNFRNHPYEYLDLLVAFLTIKDPDEQLPIKQKLILNNYDVLSLIQLFYDFAENQDGQLAIKILKVIYILFQQDYEYLSFHFNTQSFKYDFVNSCLCSYNKNVAFKAIQTLGAISENGPFANFNYTEKQINFLLYDIIIQNLYNMNVNISCFRILNGLIKVYHIKIGQILEAGIIQNLCILFSQDVKIQINLQILKIFDIVCSVQAQRDLLGNILESLKFFICLENLLGHQTLGKISNRVYEKLKPKTKPN